MKFSFLINSLEGGGAENQGRLLCRTLQPEKIFVLSGKLPPDFPNAEILTGLNPFRNFLDRGNFNLRLYSNLLSEKIKKGNTLISFMERANFTNILSKSRSGHRAVICERITPSREFSGIRALLNKPLIKKLYPKADLVVANSFGVKEDLSQNSAINPHKIEVIYNMYDIEEIETQARKNIKSKEEIFFHPAIINAGRITFQKGQNHLLRIFHAAKKEMPKLKLIILGSGLQKTELNKLAADMKLKAYDGETQNVPTREHDIYFLGHTKNPYKYISRAVLFISTSLWEGFPNALVEAMICGTPVISSDIASGPREILAPGTPFFEKTDAPEFAEFGVLMPPFSSWKQREEEKERLWAKTILDLIDSPKKLRGYRERGRERGKDFSVKKIISQWKKIILNRIL